jgi:predicted phosphohydrolase
MMSELFDVTKHVPIIVSPNIINRERCKIYSMSDLHLEFYPNHRDLWKVISPFLPNADILILAGDIGISYGINGYDEYKSLLLLFKQKYENVILIPGNHEYYKTRKYDIVSVTDTLRNMCSEINVVFLSNNMVKIKDVYFIGTTLWKKAESHIRYFMSDFGKVFPDVLS